MKRLILIILAGSAAVCTALAQHSMEEVLLRVEQASKEMEAQRRLTDARKVEARSENNLYNPSVAYENLWGRGANRGGTIGELTVTQAFDFPSVYWNRNKIAKLRGTLYDRENDIFRRELLLEAKSLCLEIIWLRQKQELLERQMESRRELHEKYKLSLESGACNIIDYTKIAIERLAVETDLKMNATELKGKLQQLTNLTGGEEVYFTLGQYPPIAPLPEYAAIENLYVEENPQLHGLEAEQEVSRQEVALNRSLSLPRFEAGYRQNFGMEGKAIGFLAGISIPMFENHNKVKAAKARQFMAQARIESARLNVRTQLKQLYEQALTLRHAADELHDLMNDLNGLNLLQKALAEGQINVIEYYNEEVILFETYERLLGMERDYQLAMARLFSFEL